MPLRRNRRQYEQLTDFDRGRIIGLREAGWSNRRIGRHLGRSDMVVARCWQQWITEGRVYRRGGQCRLDFCRPRATWSVTDWRRVIFSDESRFSLSADDHRTRVWRRTGQRSDPAFIVERHTAISQGAIYQQDNTRPHTARLSQQCLQGYDVLPWPARSPDHSPIEHVWNALGRQLQPSRDTGELTAQMQRLWQDLPQGVISDLIESMPRRISACIAARGGFTTY
ncbi:transposable element Tcb2 transposase [Trichonephila clavipes]|nr:transposable element Tcb2 transposase [Trichonephila clavipes]